MRLSTVKFRVFIIFLCFVFITSCQQSPVAESLSASDKLIIHFIERGNVVKTVTTEEKNAINKMIYAIDKGEATQISCELNGIIIFLQNNVEIQRVDFSNAPDCRYFKYNFQSKQETSSMTNETANFLQSVKEGLDYY